MSTEASQGRQGAEAARRPSDFEEVVHVEAPAQAAWDLTLDLEAWPRWTPLTVTSVEVLDSGPVRIGTRARLKQPGNRPAVWEVIRLDEGREFAWQTKSMGTVVTALHRFEETPTGVKVTLGIDIAGPTKFLLGWLVMRVSRKFVPLEAAAFKSTLEQGR